MEAIAGILARNELGLPMWAWVLAGGGAILVVIYLKRRQGASSDQSVTGGPSGSNVPSTIDPYTGVPYSIESAVNPATGLPAYYGTGSSGTPGVGGQGAGSGTTPPQSLTQQFAQTFAGVDTNANDQATANAWFSGLSLDQQAAFFAQPLAQQQATVVSILHPTPMLPTSNVTARPTGMWPGPSSFR